MTVLTREQAEAYAKLTDYLSKHPEVYEEITERYLENNNIVDIKDVKLGDSKYYDIDITQDEAENFKYTIWNQLADNQRNKYDSYEDFKNNMKPYKVI